MSLKLYHYNGGWVDISDYLVSSSPVPYISRNRDFTLRVDLWNCEIAGSIWDNATYGDSYVFANAQLFYVEVDTVKCFYGRKVQGGYDYQSRSYKLEIQSGLGYLQDYLLEWRNLHDASCSGLDHNYAGCQLYSGIATADYVPVDYYAQSDIILTFLLKKLFVKAGLTLVTTDVDADVLLTHSVEGTVQFNQIYIEENTMYCINQSVATSNTILNSYVYGDSKITFFDFLSAVCQMFGYTIVVSGIAEYSLLKATANYTVGDDDKYSYAEDSYTAENNAMRVNWQYSETLSHYRDTVATHDLTDHTDGNGWDEEIDFYTNVYLFFTDVVIETDYDDGINEGNIYTTYLLEPEAKTSSTADNFNLAMKQIQLKTLDYVEQQITCPYETDVATVTENYIDLENQTSMIIQEDYS